MNFIGLIICFLVLLLGDLLTIRLKRRNAKKCNYDCSKCKNWDCFADECNKKRQENDNFNNFR